MTTLPTQDVDLEVKVDLAELQQEFNLMTESQLIGVVPDQAKNAFLNSKYNTKNLLLTSTWFPSSLS